MSRIEPEPVRSESHVDKMEEFTFALRGSHWTLASVLLGARGVRLGAEFVAEIRLRIQDKYDITGPLIRGEFG